MNGSRMMDRAPTLPRLIAIIFMFRSPARGRVARSFFEN